MYEKIVVRQLIHAFFHIIPPAKTCQNPLPAPLFATLCRQPEASRPRKTFVPLYDRMLVSGAERIGGTADAAAAVPAARGADDGNAPFPAPSEPPTLPDIILRMEPFRRHERTAQATPSHTSTGTARRRNGLRSPKAYGIPASASASASRPALAYGAALSRSVCSGSCLPLNAHIPAMRDRRLCSGKKFIGFPDKARKCASGLVRPGETSHVFG